MASGYIPLPRPEIRNAMVDFSPLNQAVTGLREAGNQNAMFQYQADRDRVSDQRANAMLSLQQQAGARQQEEFNLNKQDRAHKALAATFQAIGQEADPTRRAALYSQVRGRVKDFDQDIIAAGGNPDDMDSAMRIVTAQATGYQPPKAPEIKEVNKRLVAVTAQPGRTPTATEIYNGAGEGAIFDDPEKRVSAETTVRKEYAQLAKPYFEVRDAFSRVQQAAANPSPAGDLALIFNFMKMLDPGSVVREGEFATAQNAAGVPDRVMNLYNRMLSGERLNPTQRQDFVGQAQGLFDRQEQQYQAVQNQYRGISERSGLDPRNTIIDYSIPQGAAGRAGGAPAQSEASSIAGGPMPPRDGPQGQIPPGAVQFLRSNPSPEIIQQFEQKYGPGSAQQFLGR